MPTNLMSEKTAKKVYFTLRKHGPMTVQELAYATGYSGSAIHNVLTNSVPHLVKRLTEKKDRAYVYKVKNKTVGFSVYTPQYGAVSVSSNGSSPTVEKPTVAVQAHDAIASINAEIRRLEQKVADLTEVNTQLVQDNAALEADLLKAHSAVDKAYNILRDV